MKLVTLPSGSVVEVARPALPAWLAAYAEALATFVCTSAVPPPVHELNGDDADVPLVVHLRTSCYTTVMGLDLRILVRSTSDDAGFGAYAVLYEGKGVVIPAAPAEER